MHEMEVLLLLLLLPLPPATLRLRPRNGISEIFSLPLLLPHPFLLFAKARQSSFTEGKVGGGAEEESLFLAVSLRKFATYSSLPRLWLSKGKRRKGGDVFGLKSATQHLLFLSSSHTFTSSPSSSSGDFKRGC